MRVLAVLLLLWSVGLVSAQEETPFTPGPELNTFMDTIETDTSALRELEALQPITRKFPTRADLGEYLRAAIAEEDLSIYEDTAQFYIAFDMLPPGADLLQIYLNFLEAQIAGFYDTDTQEMNVLLITPYRRDDRLPLLEQIIYSHEYIHALQDQHFQLDGLLGDTASQIANPDRATAILSLIEGDATAVMNEFTVLATQENPGAAMIELLAAGMSAGMLSVPPGTPRIIERELLFPYLDGSVFVSHLRSAGGWNRVNEAYTNPPQSTEHILFPERYLAGDMPVVVELTPQDELGEGWELLFDRPLGVFYLSEYLKTQLGSSETIQATKGWGGDRYRLYYNAGTDSRAWVLRLVWDTPQDAAEFYTTAITFGETRFEGVTQAENCWSREDDALCVVALPDDSVVMSFAPTLDLAAQLLDAQTVTE